MIWLSIVSLSAGALLAQRFKIIVLVPATFTVLLIAIGAEVAEANSAWSIIAMITATSVSMQAGYFIGMLIQQALVALLVSRIAARSPAAAERSLQPGPPTSASPA